MKLIYLDFDGPICNHRASESIGEVDKLTYLDPVSCKLIENLINEFDAKIVVSSTWRLVHSKKEIYNMFKSAGYHVLANAMHDRWCTPDLCRKDNKKTRGHEIEQSLSEIENHQHVEAYVILDDEEDILEYQSKHFVQCDMYDGLGFMGYCKAHRILGGTSD